MDALDFTQGLLSRENRLASVSNWGHDLRWLKQTHNPIRLNATAKRLPLRVTAPADMPIGGLCAAAKGVSLHGVRDNVGGITCCTSL